jgi:hypothetical protein
MQIKVINFTQLSFGVLIYMNEEGVLPMTFIFFWNIYFYFYIFAFCKK